MTKQNFPPVIVLNSIDPYNPVLMVVSTGMQHVLPNVISILSVGDADEQSQSIILCTVSGLMDPTGLLDDAIIVTPSGSVTLRPKAHTRGSIFFTVSCKDDGGTLNDGKDTSNSVGVNVSVVMRNSPPTLVNLPTQVSFPEWSFDFGRFGGETRKAFVFGQPLLSNDFVPSNPSAVSLTEVSIGNQPLYGSVPIFQETFQISSEQLSQVPFNIDDW